MRLQQPYLIFAALTGGVDAISHPSLNPLGAQHVSLKADKPSYVPSFTDQSPPYSGYLVGRTDWKVFCNSDTEDECKKAVDGDNSTYWRSRDEMTSHVITVDLGRPAYHVSAVAMLPPQRDDAQGLITQHMVFLSEDGNNWGDPVAYGTWPEEGRLKLSTFEPKPARYVRLVADTRGTNQTWVGVSELSIYATPYAIPQYPSRGRWGPTLDFPIVPVSAANEASGKIAVWSSWAQDFYFSTPGGQTAMSRWDPTGRHIASRVVTDTHHDMFCPGTSIDGTGMLVVTGGNDAEQTSLYDAIEDKWIPGPPMRMRRGYQSSVTVSDGRVFVIGGSWSGGSSRPKDGEIYDPKARTWTKLPGAKVDPMLTDDTEGRWRSDNHGWLFGWKDLSVFQAGPSKAMNWYHVGGNGTVTPAGPRIGDEDSMSGSAVMFDAPAGKILTLGGSPDYEMSHATNNARLITIGEPYKTPRVEVAGQNGGGMHYKRVFHSAVVLPDGTVFIAGGQTFGLAFNEENVQLTPELYFPHNNSFTQLQTNNLVRVYHSWSVLLPDATVLNGGGGLCGNCTANHYDAQIFTPPYLLNSNGNRRPRPRIISVSSRKLHVGQVGWVQTDSDISSASFIRLGSTTHTVNTDQRRIPLQLRRAIFSRNKYYFTIPREPGITIPGYWMLFVLNADGTPSVAETILVTAGNGPDDRPYDHEGIGEDSHEPTWQPWKPAVIEQFGQGL
ncbi:galactose oxidase [Aspergillus udagawae]|uniref:Galactose oxidase n=1 Tax=Aspergillus udagawae TaxID=91492 RepID=A0ABQ1BFP8_9EURO|nr:galactose oxidase [Aspergillus udagawae]GFG00686.1 galactose oxidase [Aspergillus udagawae]GFG16407.1 galactose oxidase [Aspergillus udagawae]